MLHISYDGTIIRVYKDDISFKEHLMTDDIEELVAEAVVKEVKQRYKIEIECVAMETDNDY